MSSNDTAAASVNATAVEATLAKAATNEITPQEKWDHTLENFVRKTTIGFAVGVLPALLLARSSAARCGLMALCTGVGSGIAYGEARYLFDKNITFDKRHIIQLRELGNNTSSSAAAVTSPSEITTSNTTGVGSA